MGYSQWGHKEYKHTHPELHGGPLVRTVTAEGSDSSLVEAELRPHKPCGVAGEKSRTNITLNTKTRIIIKQFYKGVNT